MIFVLVFLLILLFFYSAFITYHAIRWSKIIFSLEDKYSEALEIHQRTMKSLENILKMQLFFDSPAVKKAVEDVREDLKVCQMATQKIVFTLTEHSKRKYFLDEE